MKIIGLQIFLITNVLSVFAQEKLYLNSNWEFSQARKEDWRPATVPGTVHQDLLANRLIEDPFYYDNEVKQNWIEKVDWEYKTNFNISETQLKNENVNLVFEGLDTYTEVYINEISILRTENMFIAYEVDIKKYLKVGINNLKIYFHSPTKLNTFKAFKHDYTVPAANEFAPALQRFSVYSRKAPYHFGWDWGPRLVTSGVWRPVYLKFWNAAILNSCFHSLKTISKSKAEYKSEIELELTNEGNYDLEILVNNKKATTQKYFLKKGVNAIQSSFAISNPILWWSNGLGSQTLYTVTSNLILNKNIVASQTKRVGVRTLEVVQEKDEFAGKTFKIRLNGVDVFMKGSNYIPPDNLNPRITTEHYQKVISYTKDVNMNMLRVWGGAVYEDDRFYDLCDENGILVWQDFMFACTMTPENDEHIKNIENEFIYNIKRLRQHPSLALWCGNNENMEGWFRYGWNKSYKVNSNDSVKLLNTYKKIFYDLLPTALNKLDPTRFYWPSSPSSGYELTDYSNNISGDVHNWWLWFGKASFEQIAKDKRRFVSEYGLQSYPAKKTLMSFARAQDTTFDCYIYDYRQRSELTKDYTTSGANFSLGNELIAQYSEMYYKKPKNFESFIYQSQVMQGEGLKQIIEGHRTAKPYCWGSLYWQIDDCWPTISWATVDYFYRWKASHYILKDAYAPLLIASSIDSNFVSIKIVNDNLKKINGMVNLKLLNFEGKVLYSNSFSVDIKENSSVVTQKIELNKLLDKTSKSDSYLYFEIIENNKIVASNTLFFENYKHLNLPNSRIETTIKQLNKGVFEIEMISNTFAKNVFMTVESVDGVFSENNFDLHPQKTKKLYFKGDISLEQLNKDLNTMHLRNSY